MKVITTIGGLETATVSTHIYSFIKEKVDRPQPQQWNW